jgi:hypothetical protein
MASQARKEGSGQIINHSGTMAVSSRLVILMDLSPVNRLILAANLRIRRLYPTLTPALAR